MLLRVALAAVFLYAGVAKLRDAGSFASSIARFRIVPLVLVHPLALGLPPLEVVCALALLWGPWKRQAAFGLFLLTTIFLAALLSAAARGIHVECSCFGAAAGEPLWSAIARDVVLCAAAVALYVRSAFNLSTQHRA